MSWISFKGLRDKQTIEINLSETCIIIMSKTLQLSKWHEMLFSMSSLWGSYKSDQKFMIILQSVQDIICQKHISHIPKSHNFSPPQTVGSARPRFMKIQQKIKMEVCQILSSKSWNNYGIRRSKVYFKH